MRLNTWLAALEVIEARHGNQSHRREELQPEPNRAPTDSTVHASTGIERAARVSDQSTPLSCSGFWSIAAGAFDSHHPACAKTRGYDAKKYLPCVQQQQQWSGSNNMEPARAIEFIVVHRGV